MKSKDQFNYINYPLKLTIVLISLFASIYLILHVKVSNQNSILNLNTNSNADVQLNGYAQYIDRRNDETETAQSTSESTSTSNKDSKTNSNEKSKSTSAKESQSTSTKDIKSTTTSTKSSKSTNTSSTSTTSTSDPTSSEESKPVAIYNQSWMRFIFVLFGFIFLNMIAICIHHIYLKITRSQNMYRSFEDEKSPF
ncbi:hypothetical protein KGF54_002291 [Candida jiufengensis]|uniref:uncharacterized protein n=1 Tax=Candida jiufengensis TaxID=497108 RepID=UPI00222482D4|nr:uncharacterized protein KGF54_002291 [Candida jiufengensis]KAI5954516.1 hypothetical protein KGF54_002291 [Candida jiufengensis]